MMMAYFSNLLSLPEETLGLVTLGLLTFVMGTVGFCILKSVHYSKNSFLKPILSIPARKSTTNAIQLGGLPLSLAIIAGLTIALNFEPFVQYFSPRDLSVTRYWIAASVVIILYGHLDDKFELRPIVKLMMQVFSVCFFALCTSYVLYPEWSAVSFILLGFWGMGVVNGSNLLDGLDTLTIKLGSTTMLGFFFLSYYFSIPTVAITSTTGLAALASFYYFNKEPAQVHLGEIGGSFVGFLALLSSCLVFNQLSVENSTILEVVNTFFLSVLPLSLPMVELSVSFSRRLYNRKSPFKGDKYHLHHILRNYYHHTPSMASSIFALSYGSCLVLGLIALTGSDRSHYGITSFALTNILMIVGYVMVGKKHWRGQDTIDLKPAALFDYLRKKDVAVINSLEFDEFVLEIVTEGDESQEDLVEADEVEMEEEVEERKAS